jgi:hypothetical protein
MKLTIPDVPPSLNKVLRMHWAKKRQLKRSWHLQVWAETGLGPVPSAPVPRKRKVGITLHHSRFYDKDNAYGACKVLVDVLRAEGLIYDDTAEWLDLTVEQAKCPHKQRHTVIEIEVAA